MSTPPIAELDVVLNEDTLFDIEDTIPGIDTINNEFLLENGIKDDSPEIIAMSEFPYMYQKNRTGPAKKNSNFDFMMFQTQLDLVIKDIINKKIENDESLKNRILENYKNNLKIFEDGKTSLESFYTNVINIAEIFNLKENLKSEIKSKQSGPLSSARSESISANNRSETGVSVSSPESGRLANRLGFSFNEEYLTEFLISHALNEIENAETKLEGCNLYVSLIDFIFNAYFSKPLLSFEEEPTHNIDRVMSLTSGNFNGFVSEISVLSRSNHLSNPESSTKELKNSAENRQYTFQEWKSYGNSVIGSKESISVGVDKPINKAYLRTSDSLDVQVFNSFLDESAPVYETTLNLVNSSNLRTGREYFLKDISTKLLSSDSGNTDLYSYSSDMKNQIVKIKNYIEKNYDIYGTGFFNSAIRDVAKAAIKAFKIDSLESNNSTTINADSNLDVYGSIMALDFIANNDVVKNTEFFIGDGGTTASQAYITVETPAGYEEEEEEILIEFESPAGPASNDGEGAIAAETTVITRDRFNELKSSMVQFQIEYDVRGYASDEWRRSSRAIARFFDEISKTDMYKSGYVPKTFVLKVSLKILKYIVKDFKAYFFLGSKTYVLLNKKGHESLHVLKDIEYRESTFVGGNEKHTKRLFGKSRPDTTFSFDRVLNLYKQTSYGYFASLNIATSLYRYFSKINLKSNISFLKGLNISEIPAGDFDFNNVGIPSIERLVNLNVGFKNILYPTTSFNDGASYFPYKNTRTSSDLALINEFHKQNVKYLSIDKNYEGIRIAAVAIPDGLINNLRISSNRTNNHTIIEISLVTLNHKNSNSPNRYTCRYKFIFNTCLHVNTINPDIDVLSKASSENMSIEDILNVDSRSKFENIDFNEKDLISFNYGNIKNQKFGMQTFRSFNDAIKFNTQNYQITSLENPLGNPEYDLNNSMSAAIVKNHVINYILKKQSEIFSGAALYESSFPFAENLPLEKSQESLSLINYFANQPYSNDLKDYLTRTSSSSSIINPSNQLFSSLGISKFERIFFLPCFQSKKNQTFSSADSNLMTVEDHFSFESLIPIVRLL